MTRKEYIEKQRELNRAMEQWKCKEKLLTLAVKYNADMTGTKESEVWDMVLCGDPIDDLDGEELMHCTNALIASVIY